jgi:uncharacterized lipoprotein
MKTLRMVVLGLGAGTLVLAAGCRSPGTCRNSQAYAAAEEVPALKMPAGLDGPDTREAMQVPPLTEPEVPRPAKGPCLEEPTPLVKPAAPAQTTAK